MKKHYQTLGLKEGASQEEINTAYDKLSKELNPSNNDNQEFFEEEYKKVQEAYKALSNYSILATENGAKSLKKIKSKSNDKESVNPKNTLEKKTSKKDSFIIDWIFIILGGLLFGSFFSYLIGVYYYKDESIESLIEMDFKTLITVNKNPNYLISEIFANFLIGFIIFLILMGLIKRIFKLNSKKLLIYFGKRKKNISLLLVVIPIIKIILHYSFYPITSRQRIAKGDYFYPIGMPYRNSIGEHIDVLFEAELNLFLVAAGIVLFIVWIFNNKIKAR